MVSEIPLLSRLNGGNEVTTAHFAHFLKGKHMINLKKTYINVTQRPTPYDEIVTPQGFYTKKHLSGPYSIPL